MQVVKCSFPKRLRSDVLIKFISENLCSLGSLPIGYDRPNPARLQHSEIAAAMPSILLHSKPQFAGWVGSRHTLAAACALAPHYYAVVIHRCCLCRCCRRPGSRLCCLAPL